MSCRCLLPSGCQSFLRQTASQGRTPTPSQDRLSLVLSAPAGFNPLGELTPDLRNLITQASVPDAGMAKDPVCGMSVSEKSQYRSEHEGRTFYFCCAGCKSSFDRDPHKYSR